MAGRRSGQLTLANDILLDVSNEGQLPADRVIELDTVIAAAPDDGEDLRTPEVFQLLRELLDEVLLVSPFHSGAIGSWGFVDLVTNCADVSHPDPESRQQLDQLFVVVVLLTKAEAFQVPNIDADSPTKIGHLEVDLVETVAVLNEDRLGDLWLALDELQRSGSGVEVEDLRSQQLEDIVLPALHVVSKVDSYDSHVASYLVQNIVQFATLIWSERGREQRNLSNAELDCCLDLRPPVSSTRGGYTGKEPQENHSLAQWLR